MASNTQYYIWAAPFENAYLSLRERRFGIERGVGSRVSEDERK
jgi:hypothetical protein